MPYPPPVPPATRTDATVMATNHPADHNTISAALTEILNHIATMEQALYPIGVIVLSGADNPPGNHELCRGQEVLKATYPEVFALIGTKFGNGNGGTTFNMPNFCSRVPVGMWPGGAYGTVLGQIIGNANSSLPNHYHGVPHEHGVNLWSSYDGDHNHLPSPPGENFVTNGSGGISAGIGEGSGYMLDTLTSVNGNHRHATNGSTDGGGGLNTQWNGVDPTNTNLQPSIAINFVMRMH